jgi:hypothetical protein
MRKAQIALLGFALLGWGVCGATIGVGRQLLSMQVTLVMHAIVAPVAFWLLAWRYRRWFPEVSAGRISLTMLAVVVGLDAFLVAPLFEHSFAMFRSWLGTWLPMALILVAAYAGARHGRHRV